MSGTHVTPTTADAITVVEATLGATVTRCERFTTGIRHWVYDVELSDGRQVVARLTVPERRPEFRGGVYWSQQLRSVGVPVPDLLAADPEAALPFMLLERLPGTDLGNVVSELTEDQLDDIARDVAGYQVAASSLPRGQGFGYATGPDTALQQTWLSVVRSTAERAVADITAIGIVDPAGPRHLLKALDGAAEAFGDIEPVPFLHDATTKNVIIADGRVQGIVDTDQMGYGDPMWVVALTRMSVLANGYPPRYAERLVHAMGPVDQTRLDLYTAVYAAVFLAEIGQDFNRKRPQPVAPEQVNRLSSLLERFVPLKELG